MKNIELKIEGMHCEGCSSRLTRVLNAIEGVKAEVSLEEKIAKIEYDENSTTLEEIKEAIQDAEFEVVE